MGSSVLDCEGMKDTAYAVCPRWSLWWVRTSIQRRPPRPRRLNSHPGPTGSSGRSVSSVRALPPSSLLLVYQAELEEDMAVSPEPAAWEDICNVTDHCLQLHKAAVQSLVRAMGLMVLQERAWWLNLTTLSTKEKEDLLETPITSGYLFSAVVTHAKTV